MRSQAAFRRRLTPWRLNALPALRSYDFRSQKQSLTAAPLAVKSSITRIATQFDFTTVTSCIDGRISPLPLLAKAGRPKIPLGLVVSD
jgi:hypothetical protein